MGDRNVPKAERKFLIAVWKLLIAVGKLLIAVWKLLKGQSERRKAGWKSLANQPRIASRARKQATPTEDVLMIFRADE